MNLSPVVLAIPVFFLLMAIEFIVLRFQKNDSYRLNDALTNINCGIVSQVTGVFLKVLSVGVYILVFEYLRLFTIPNSWISFVILFILFDFCYYWAHRMSHEINLFWGGHVVHHSSEEYNLSVALRQSSTQIIWTFIFYLPLAFLGFDPVSFVLVNGLNLLYQFWIHTESIGKMGWLEKILNTPSHHRVHHGRNPKYIDKNHGGTFILFDKWFGTFQEEAEKPTYGITTPVNSWNPVKINLEHYKNMWNEIGLIPSWKDKIRYLFYKPGWLPQEMGGYRIPEEITGDEIKYNADPPQYFNYYILAQYAVILITTAVFLFNLSDFRKGSIVVISLLIIWSTISISGFFELSKVTRLLEFVRLMTLSSVLYYEFKGYFSSEILLIFSLTTYFLISSTCYAVLMIKGRKRPGDRN